MDRARARQLIGDFDFASLFADELMWNRLPGTVLIEIDGKEIVLRTIAEKKQVQVLLCAPAPDGTLPPYAVRQKIERQVTRQAREHLIIYADERRTAQVWQWVAREPGRPSAYREIVWQHGQTADLLLEKLGLIAFRLEEDDTLLTVLDVAGRLRDAFDRDKLTKRFYDDFKLERDAFLRFIRGLSGHDAAWYTSVMINRLMFVYFLQRKRLANNEGFLDNRHDYLRHHLNETQRKLGENRFYRDFLCPLFFQGFAQAERRDEVKARFGDIPFLNGGLFNRHPLEMEHGNEIHIADSAFEKVFDYFDAWDWHLDDRPLQRSESALRSEHLKGEINPEVLGYIFEKYINQKQLGAYYTKEDITGYICRNTIVPGLLDKVRARCGKEFDATAWPLLKQDPDDYIWPAMRHGADQPLPEDIAAGLDPNQANLLQKRKAWNRRAPEIHALPTEIWREHVARRQRYEEIKAKHAAGELREVNDLITYNLDIAQFAQDIVERSESPGIVRAMWRTLTGVVPDIGSSQREFEYGFSVLDPTCGSGAFLFAALNILEPLYRACLTRMRGFVLQADLEGGRQKFPDFRKILDDVDRRPNESYFICKSIIVNNLYGVDIVEEAVEIAKLRLFLKLVAQLQDKRHIEPLPDIDFNIRAGNALVGFATYDEVKKAVTHESSGQGKMLFDDAMTLIEQDAHAAERAYLRFRQQQVALGGEVTAEDKQALRDQLTALEERLNWYLAREYGIDPHRTDKVEKWKASHRPFHWFVDFYGILKNGGFDTVVGNPPFVEYSKVRDEYSLLNYETEGGGNLYCFVAERTQHLIGVMGWQGLIVPISLTCVSETDVVRQLITGRNDLLYTSNFAIRPAKLFDGVEQRLTILLARASAGGATRLFSSKYHQWFVDERSTLFARLRYVEVPKHLLGTYWPKLGSDREVSILGKLSNAEQGRIGLRLVGNSEYLLVFHRTPGYWIRMMNFEPYFRSPTANRSIHHIRVLHAKDRDSQAEIGAIVNSSTYFWWFFAAGNCRNLTLDDVRNFRLSDLKKNRFPDLRALFLNLMKNFQANSARKRRGDAEFQEFEWSKAKPVIDEIDQLLGSGFDFAAEDLDFLINYDIKVRMSDAGAAVDD